MHHPKCEAEAKADAPSPLGLQNEDSKREKQCTWGSLAQKARARHLTFLTCSSSRSSSSSSTLRDRICFSLPSVSQLSEGQKVTSPGQALPNSSAPRHQLSCQGLGPRASRGSPYIARYPTTTEMLPATLQALTLPALLLWSVWPRVCGEEGQGAQSPGPDSKVT